MIIDQPDGGSVGAKIIELLEDESQIFTDFYIVAAYAKRSGVSRLMRQICSFRESGGTVRAVIGIDQKNTSYQGLKLLLQICDEVWIYHNAHPSQTFHPKAYAVVSDGVKAVLLIGSSNLTAGGLFTNCELVSLCEYDFTVPEDEEEFRSFKVMFERFSSLEGFSKKLTSEFLEALREDGRYLSEEGAGEGQSTIDSQAGTPGSGLFSSRAVKPPSPSHPEPDQSRRRGRTDQTPGEGGVRPLLWKKSKLPASDVEYPRMGSNPTGCLRFVQAGWRVDGQEIDQTKYFRGYVFGKLNWKIVRTSPKVEAAMTSFRVKILGVDKGVHELEIRHKPSGEAGQGNYTTSLSWGPLAQMIGAMDLRGRTFYIYGPVTEDDTFLIEIS